MPIPLEKIQAVEDEIERLDYKDNDTKHPHTTTTTTTRTEQDFSFLNKPQIKRSVHYDAELLDNHEYRPLRPICKTEQPSIDNVLRQRYIAHWGLPGITKQKRQLAKKKFLFSFK